MSRIEPLSRDLLTEVVACPVGAPAYRAGYTTATFTYDPADPFAVLLTASDADWYFARELLADGVNAGAGIGDVYIYPDVFAPELKVWVCLFGADDLRCAQLSFSRPSLERFLDDTAALVPEGTEATRIDWSAELAALGGER